MTKARVSTEDLWSATFGSSGEEFPWWEKISFTSGNWETPGKAIVVGEDPEDEDARIICVVGTTDIRRAYNKACHAGMVDACTGHPINDMDVSDFDACVADLILQLAVYGKEVYA